MAQLTRQDLDPALAAYAGNHLFAEVLAQIDGSTDLLRALSHYIYFNSVFGGGVANLAGEIAVRQQLFRDPEEPVRVLADRSVEVASDVFFAAVDEFDDRIAPHRDTHRSLAQATLKATGAYLGLEGVALDAVTQPNASTLEAVRNVRAGYGVNQSVDEAGIFRGLGFHLGSELLADEEFNVLDAFLRAKHAGLQQHLESAEVEIGGTHYPAYFWIRVHTSVEVDHFDAAVKGINTALRFYAGERSAAEARADVLRGVEEFARVQNEFMRRLLEA